MTTAPTPMTTDAPDAAAQQRPWPVVVLTALGAWLSLVPFALVLVLVFGDIWDTGPGPFVFAAVAVGVAVAVIRGSGRSLFVEQLAWPLLLLGMGALAYGLDRDLPAPVTMVVMALVLIGVSVPVPPPSLRALLGAAAWALLSLAAFFELDEWVDFEYRLLWHGLLTHASVLLVAALMVARHGLRARPAAAAWAHALLMGAAVIALLGLAQWGGTPHIDVAWGGSRWRSTTSEIATGEFMLSRVDAVWLAISVLSLGAVLARLWRDGIARGHAWLLGVGGLLLVLSAAIAGLGLALAAALLLVRNGRRKFACLPAAVALWILGLFYYQLAWPLVWKGVLLAVVGLLLWALGQWGLHRATPAADPIAVGAVGGALNRWSQRSWLALAGVLALVVVNVGIWQKEALIRDGEPVYVALAPVDPRSLMQGDYMALSFDLPRLAEAQDAAHWDERGAHYAVLVRDARGVATVQRYDDGTAPLKAGEIRMQLTRRSLGWTLVTDAWFFREGEAERWAQARFGEFRVDAGGRALLVNLRGEDLAPL